MIKERLTVPFDLAPAHVNRQRAAAVAALGTVYFAEGKTETAEEHKPDYLRKSQAEREREEREAKETEKE
jgi:tRNA threonylcarbamoyladenosine biosynthesis protein TsaB